MERKRLLYGSGIILLLVAITLTGMFFVQGSIVEGGKDELSFHMIPEGNLGDNSYDGYDPSDSYYINDDNSAVLGDYQIQVSDFGRRNVGDGCGIEVRISHENEEIVDSEAVQAHSMANMGLEDKNLDGWTHEGYSFQFGNPMYMDATFYDGEFYGVNCGTTFSRIKMPVNMSAVDVEMDVANETTESFTTLEVTASNDWKPVMVNGTVEACSQGDCVEAPLGAQSVSSGDTIAQRVEVPVKNVTDVSVEGGVYLDLGKYPISGLSYNGENTGEMDYIQIASLSGSDEVVKVERSVEEPEDPGDGEQVSTPDDEPEQEPVGEVGMLDQLKLFIENNIYAVGGFVVAVLAFMAYIGYRMFSGNNNGSFRVKVRNRYAN